MVYNNMMVLTAVHTACTSSEEEPKKQVRYDRGFHHLQTEILFCRQTTAQQFTGGDVACDVSQAVGSSPVK